MSDARVVHEWPDPSLPGWRYRIVRSSKGRLAVETSTAPRGKWQVDRQWSGALWCKQDLLREITRLAALEQEAGR